MSAGNRSPPASTTRRACRTRAALSPMASAIAVAPPGSIAPERSAWHRSSSDMTTRAPPGSTCVPSLRWSRSAKPPTSRPVARTRSATTLPWPPAPQMSTRSVCIAAKRVHGDVSVVGDPVLAPHVPERAHQDPEVQRQAQVVHVVYVQRELLRPRERVAAVHLRPSGDTRAHCVPALLLGRIERKVLHEQGTRTDQTHVTPDDIHQFRKLVQTGGAQQAAQRSESRCVRQRRAVGTCGVPHRAELEEREGPAMKTGADLAEDHRTAETPTNRSGNEQQEWAKT